LHIKIGIAMTTLHDIGNTLKAYRKRLGLTQSELAAKCKLHRNTVSALENGVGNIELNSLLAICEQLGLDLVFAPADVSRSVEHFRPLAEVRNKSVWSTPGSSADVRPNLVTSNAGRHRLFAEPTSLQKRVAERLAATADRTTKKERK
jgi:transcriptional regulator with XRE-family HTH domain